MSILAPMDLLGSNSSCVESLEHYGARLAFMHCVKPARIFALARDAANAVSNESKMRTFSYQAICGYGPVATRLAMGLERLTGKAGLSAGTLLPFSGVLTSRVTGVFVHSRRWCPICYLKPAEERYDLLAWQLATVTHCPIDGVRLAESCRECRATQVDFESLDGDRYVCRVCSASLGWVPAAERSETTWERWSNRSSKDLIQFTSSNPEGIKGNPWSIFLTALQDNGRLSPDKSVRDFRVLVWKSNKSRPRLTTVFQYAALQSVPPLQVLLDPLGASSATLPLAVNAIMDTQPTGSLASRNHKHLRYAAAVMAETHHGLPLPPPVWMARLFKVNRSNWRESDRVGYGRYVSAHKRSWVGSAGSLDLSLYSRALAYVQRELNVGSEKTVGEIIRDLSMESGASDPARVKRAVLSTLIVAGIFRRLRPGEVLEVQAGRVNAKTRL